MTQAYNLSQLANKVNTSGQLDATTGLYNTSSLGFPSGTRMSFNQTSAPTGWTKDTSSAISDAILRLVTGSVSSGGSTAFSTWNSSGTTGATTLSTSQIPSHTHGGVLTNNYVNTYSYGVSQGGNPSYGAYVYLFGSTASEGGGSSHNHSLSNNIKYYDFIIAQKD